MTTRRATDSETAPATGSRERSNKVLDAFITTKFQIDVMLERLKCLWRRPFDTHPDKINLGDVGTLNHYASLLRQITDSAFKEREHAA